MEMNIPEKNCVPYHRYYPVYLSAILKTAFQSRIKLLSFGVIILFFTGSVWAHKVPIFGWVEGDTVFIRSKSSGGKRVKNGKIIVYDDKGNSLLSGKTDANGEFSFKIPKKTALRIVIEADHGHKNQWQIPVNEIAPGITKVEENNDSAVSLIAPDTPGPETRDPVSSICTLSPNEIKALVDNSISNELKIIKNMILNIDSSGPSISDIFSGIGYIFGLMGIGAYFNYRRKQRGLSEK